MAAGKPAQASAVYVVVCWGPVERRFRDLGRFDSRPPAEAHAQAVRRWLTPDCVVRVVPAERARTLVGEPEVGTTR